MRFAIPPDEFLASQPIDPPEKQKPYYPRHPEITAEELERQLREDNKLIWEILKFKGVVE